MVRAIVKRGRVHLLDPLPRDWTEGRALLIESREAAEAGEDLDRWLEEFNTLGDPFEEPGEWDRFQTNLAEADRLAKECVRRQMELP